MEKQPCPSCGSYNTTSEMALDSFNYGVGTIVRLQAMVEVFSCHVHNCKMEWTGERAEIARQEAITAHLASVESDVFFTVPGSDIIFIDEIVDTRTLSDVMGEIENRPCSEHQGFTPKEVVTMDTKSGELMSLEQAYQMPKERQEDIIELTDEEAVTLKSKSLSERMQYASGLNREQRRALARNRPVKQAVENAARRGQSPSTVRSFKKVP